MAETGHEQTLAQLRLLAHLPGFWELRALRRNGATRMTPRGSFWIVATATADGLLYECLDQALAWADANDRQGTEIFVGVNARSTEGKTKASVPAVTCCFADRDLAGQGSDEALAALTDGQGSPPSFVVHSGYGLHAVWLLCVPSRDKARWRVVQQALGRAFADYGADPACAPDEARVLRLVPYPNRKLSPEGVPTVLVLESGTRYDLAALLDAFVPPSATTFGDIGGPAPAFTPPPEAGPSAPSAKTPKTPSRRAFPRPTAGCSCRRSPTRRARSSGSSCGCKARGDRRRWPRAPAASSRGRSCSSPASPPCACATSWTAPSGWTTSTLASSSSGSTLPRTSTYRGCAMSECCWRPWPSGVAQPTWERETFAYAEGWDGAQGRYRGLVCGQQARIVPDGQSVLVRPEAALRQLENDHRKREEAKNEPTCTLADSLDIGKGDQSGTHVNVRSVGQNGRGIAGPRRLRRFHGMVELDTLRVSRDAGRIAEEIVQHLSTLASANVRVRLEIDAEMPNGIPDNVVRTVFENCRTLTFISQGFEEE